MRCQMCGQRADDSYVEKLRDEAQRRFNTTRHTRFELAWSWIQSAIDALDHEGSDEIEDTE